MKLRQVFSEMLRFVAVWAVLATLFTGAVIAVHCIPRDAVEDNAAAGLEDLTRIPHNVFTWFSIDSYSDALMLDECISAETDAPVQAAMQNVYYTDSLSGYNFKTFCAGHYSSPTAERIVYGRYWHGNQVVVRPAMATIGYRGLVIFNILLFVTLFVLTVRAVSRRISRKLAWAFGLAVICSELPFCLFSLQFFSCHILMLAASLIFLLYPSLTADIKTGAVSFFCLGALTSFFDLLSFPLVVLCYPLILVLARVRCQRRLLKAVAFSVIWSLGYLSLWAAKWLVFRILTGRSILEDAMQSVSIRLGEMPAIGSAKPYFMIVLGCILGISLLIYSVIRARKVADYLYLVFIAATPLVWLLVIKNHSIVHYFFTWRLMIIPAFCLVTFYISDSRRRAARMPSRDAMTY